MWSSDPFSLVDNCSQGQRGFSQIFGLLHGVSYGCRKGYGNRITHLVGNIGVDWIFHFEDLHVSIRHLRPWRECTCGCQHSDERNGNDVSSPNRFHRCSPYLCVQPTGVPSIPLRAAHPTLIARTSAARASIGITGSSPDFLTGRLRRWSMIACHSLISRTASFPVTVATLLLSTVPGGGSR